MPIVRKSRKNSGPRRYYENKKYYVKKVEILVEKVLKHLRFTYRFTLLYLNISEYIF